MQNIILKVTGVIRKVEKYFLVIVLALMIGLSCLQIFLRTFFKAITWVDTFLNYSVLWSAMIAGGIVTYEASHIKIDLVGRFSKGKIKESLYSFTSFFGGCVSAVLMSIFLVYIVVVEYYSRSGMSSVNAYRWFFLLILPAGFFVISVRFYNRMLTYNFDLMGKRLMGMISSAVSIAVPSVIFFAVTAARLKGLDISIMGEEKALNIILLISLIVILSGGAGLYNSLLWKKPRLTYYLSSVSGVYYGLLFIYIMLKIVEWNILGKVRNEVIPFNENQLNSMYVLPALFFFLSHYSFFYPLSNYFLKLYPRPDHEHDAEAV